MYCWAWIVVELLGQVPQQAHTQSLGMQWVEGLLACGVGG